MISFLAYTKSKNELTLLKQTVTDISSVLSDEDLKMVHGLYLIHMEQALMVVITIYHMKIQW